MMKSFLKKSVITGLIISASVFNNNSFAQLPTAKTENLKNIIDYLCSPGLNGRLSGQPGYDRTAEFAAEKFKEYGLVPLAGKDYFQYFSIETNQVLERTRFYSLHNGVKKEYKLGEDYIFRGFTGSGNLADKDVVFCGYGFSRPELGFDEYSGLDVSGKVVMVFKQNPGWQINKASWGNGYPREKALTAFEKGAVGIIFVSLPNVPSPQAAIGSVLDGEGIQNENFPMLHIELKNVPDFLDGTGLSISHLQSVIDSTQKPYSIELKTRTGIFVKTDYLKDGMTMNIAGLLEGNDPELKDEYIIVGAHIDHVGSQGGEVYFPGANDNASGSAAVLEAARILACRRGDLKRSVIFVLFASEEIGLNGSSHFVKNSPVPLNKITAMINFDCVGSGDSIQIGNGKSCPVLWSIAKGLDEKGKKLMMERTWSGGGADATPFHNAGIPSLYFVSFFSYNHLHKTSDLPENLNFSLLREITELGIETVLKISGDEYRKESIKE
ncbi:MAG: M20/M25/M40 family metallo-hydrolase [Ignavibacteriaceae bacterium]